MKSICLIMPYFGEFPPWFKFWLKTCEYNPTVEWFFLTDQDFPENCPPNVKHFKADLEYFNQLATSTLGFDINLTFPYKICDLRPAFGKIFQQVICNYDFWGFGDIDLIYGNIRKFCSDEVLKRYDIISAREKFLTGHFTLYRNVDKVNDLYKAMRWHKFLFQHKEYKKFDEKHMTAIVKYQARGINTLFQDFAGSDGGWCLKKWHKQYGWSIDFDNGTLANSISKDEYMYFHFYNLKQEGKVVVPDIKVVPSKFSITDKGFTI